MKGDKVKLEHSMQMRCLYQISNVRGRKLLELFPQYSKAIIYRHVKKSINLESPFDKRKLNKGRPPKLSTKDKRKVLRTIKYLREEVGSFTSKRVQIESGVTHVCNKSIRNILNKAGYFYLKSRKKGLLTMQDLIKRVRFCRKVKRHRLSQHFWSKRISIYLDGKGFAYKQNPKDQARAPKAREWRRKGEGLSYGCTSKGKKEGCVNANFIVGISHSKGVVLCEQYFGPINGKKFAEIVENSLPACLQNSVNPRERRILMDNCPRQNSRVARDAFDKIGAAVFLIPARSPDLNPIENLFHIISRKLSEDALDQDIQKETFSEFSDRVRQTMLTFEASKIDKIIDTMDKRINLIMKRRGQRLKY